MYHVNQNMFLRCNACLLTTGENLGIFCKMVSFYLPLTSAHKAGQVPATAFGFTGSQEKAVSCPNKLYIILYLCQ
jgi:hypothetical protein